MKKIVLSLVMLLAVAALSAQNTRGKNNVKESVDEPTFIAVEQMPEFPGGDLELRKYIAANIKYPEEAKAKGLSGKVFVQFIIDKNGDVVNPKIARGIDPILDNEAIRVIKSLPKWKPGEQSKRVDGEKVWVQKNVSWIVPVDFQIK